MKKNHYWSFSWDFCVENRYTVDQEQKKNNFHNLVWRPAPSPSHNTVSLNGEILTILWKCMTRFPILYIFAFVLSSFAFQFTLKLPRWPNFNTEFHKNWNITACTDFKVKVTSSTSPANLLRPGMAGLPALIRLNFHFKNVIFDQIWPHLP